MAMVLTDEDIAKYDEVIRPYVISRTATHTSAVVVVVVFAVVVACGGGGGGDGFEVAV